MWYGIYLNVKCLDAVLVSVVAAVADDRVQLIGFVVAVDSLPDWPIDLFVVAMHRVVHAQHAVNDSEYASADEFVVVAAVHEHHQHSDEVEIASDQIRSMICDSDLNDFVDLSFVIAVVSRASNDLASVRLSCVVDKMHFDPFAHDCSQCADSVVPVDVESLHLDRSRDTIVCLVALVVHPDTLDALHFANNAVVVIFAAFVVSAVDLNCRTLVAASSYCRRYVVTY